jgi:signal transduction histidine kinase
MVSTPIDTERTRRQSEAVRIVAWVCVAAFAIFTTLDLTQNLLNWRSTLARAACVPCFLLTAEGTRRGWLRPSVSAFGVTALALAYCAFHRDTVSDAGLFPIVAALAPVVVPQRMRVAIPLLVAALIFALVRGAPEAARMAIIGTSFGVLMAWLSERHMTQATVRGEALHVASSRSALDSERARLARDLHDHVGARLTAIALRAERDRGRLPESAAPALRWVQSSAQLCLEELRDTIWGLSATERDAAELLAVLRRRAEDVATEAGLELRWQATAPSWEGSLSAGIGVALSAILREALTNVVRHSEASAIDIRLSRDESSLTLEIKDNGRGLPEPNRNGRGLYNMRSRAEEQQGEAQIENAVPAGVRVWARLPLHVSSQHRIES